VLVVLFLPEGIVGTLMRKLRWFRPGPVAPLSNAPPGPAEESKRVPLPQPE
jgi:hypothetical protein